MKAKYRVILVMYDSVTCMDIRRVNYMGDDEDAAKLSCVNVILNNPGLKVYIGVEGIFDQGGCNYGIDPVLTHSCRKTCMSMMANIIDQCRDLAGPDSPLAQLLPQTDHTE